MTEKENKITIFTMHVHSNMRHMVRIPTEGERVHAINKAFQFFHTARDSGNRSDMYAAAVHLAAVAGKYAIHHGDEKEAVRYGRASQKQTG